jgi:drug/metabolite transporter (DMT)-like permease
VDRSLRLKIALALATVYVVWGSTYLAIRWTVVEIPALAAGSLRFVIAGLGFIALARARGPIAVTRPQLASAALVGALMPGLSNGLVALAERSVPSSLTALILAVMPLWLALLQSLRGSRPAPRAFAGLLVGFSGTALLVWSGEGGAVSGAGVAMLLAASLIWAAGSLYARGADPPRPWMLSSGIEMLAGGCLQGILALLNGDVPTLLASSPSGRAVGALVYLTVVGAWAGYGAFSWLIRHARPALVATYSYVNPLVAVILGFVLGGEPLGLRTLCAAGLVVGSVVLVGTARRER